jgi:hypothetical protein
MNVYQRRFSPIGQGFMVRGVGNGTVQMKNAYRVFVKEGVVNNSQFERTADETASIDYGFYDSIVNVAGVDYTQISMAPTPHFIVNTSLNNQAVRQIAIGFMPTATDGIDRADSKFPEDYDSMVADMYLVLNDTPFVHSITNFDITKRFPIGFKNATTGNFTYTMKVNDFVNFEADNVYLFDYETGLYHDIKNSVYDVVLAPGIYNNRFEITFTNDALGTEEAIKENLVIVQNNTNHLLSVSNPNAVEIKSAALYDIVGKQIFNEVNLGTNSSYSFSTANLSEGVYIVKLATPSHKNIGQKIIVKK